MASLTYELRLRDYLDSQATYTHASRNGTLSAGLTVTLSRDELVAEFGLVPTGIDVIVRVDSMTQPADAWLDAQQRRAEEMGSYGRQQEVQALIHCETIPKPAEARQWAPGITDPAKLAAWCGGVREGPEKLRLETAPGIGKPYAEPGDWIMRGREGGYLILSAAEFAARFRAVRPVT